MTGLQYYNLFLDIIVLRGGSIQFVRHERISTGDIYP